MSSKMPTWAISLAVHLVVISTLGLVNTPLPRKTLTVAIETFFKDEERPPDEFTREFDTSNVIAQTNNVIAGGLVSTGTPGGGGGMGGTGGGQTTMGKIDSAAATGDPVVALSLGDVTIPGGESFATDLGMGQVAGESGAVVGGYGPALDRLTQELLREMRDQKICAVWMFDESESMKDDQADIKTRIHRVYEELRIVDEKGKGKEKDYDLVTAITSFGANLHFQTPKGKVVEKQSELMRAIDNIPTDPTGAENTCASLIKVVEEYRSYFTKARRKLIVIIVSDESGDDGQLVEEAIDLCKKNKVSVYILGREAVFGYPYAYITWTEPTYKDVHWLPVRRGPETPYAELLQFDGFVARNDASLSGFGPYEQCRIARDTGGIFFMLPGEDQNVVNADKREYAALDLKPYSPELKTRRDYAATRDANPFRKAIWDVIGLLDPHVPGNEGVVVPVHGYVLAKGQYEASIGQTLARCSRTWELLNQAQAKLESVSSLRAKEDSRRWRANYDLMLAQVKSYRVRLFQYAIGLEHFASQVPTMKHNPKNNRWGVGHGAAELMKPSEVQEKKYKVSLADLKVARDEAIKGFNKVISEHPNTPWANKASWEKTRGYGASYGEWFDPPPPVRKPTDPKPQPVPKL